MISTRQHPLIMTTCHHAEFERYRRPTHRDQFFSTTKQVVPLAGSCAVIDPHCPNPNDRRLPVGLQRMLRMYFIQHWSNTATKAAKTPCSTAPRCGDSWVWTLPLTWCAAITLMKFRRTMGDQNVGTALFANVVKVLQVQGLKVGTGNIMDASTHIRRFCTSAYVQWPYSQPDRFALDY